MGAISVKQEIPSDWQPTEDAIKQILQSGIDREFALSLVPEFIIYWREVGATHHAWSGKFFKHSMHEWRRHEMALAQGRIFGPMTSNWQPTQQVINTLAQGGIQSEFSRACVPEFRIYWIDQGTITNTWNTRFLGHVRYRWLNRHVRMPYGVNNGR
jgi:hypothetical protein